MDCQKIKPLLDEFAEGELTSPQKEFVEQHLTSCAACQNELSAIRDTISLLKHFAEVDEPPDFVHELRERIKRPQTPAILGRLFPRPVPARVLASIGCILLAACGSWLVYKHFFPSPPPGTVAKYPTEAESKPVELARVYRDKAGVPTEEAEKLVVGVPVAGEEGRGSAETKGKRGEEIYSDENALQRLHYKKGVETPAEASDEGLSGAAADRTAHPTTGKKLADGDGDTTKLAMEKPEAEQAARYTALRDVEAFKEPEKAKSVEESYVGLLAPEKGRPDDSADLGGPAGAKRRGESAPQPEPAEFVRIPAPAEPEKGEGVTAEGTGRRADALADTAPQGKEELPILSSRKEVPGKAPAARDTRAKDMPRDVAEVHGPTEPGQLREEEAPPYGTRPEAVKSSAEKENEAVYFYDRTAGYVVINGDFGAKVAETGGVELRAGDLSQLRAFLLGRIAEAGRYRLTGGDVPQITFAVKDRRKALADITKMIADIGGTVEPGAEQMQRTVRGTLSSDANILLVKLKPDAYRSLVERIAAVQAAGEPSSGTASLDGKAPSEVTQPKPQDKEMVTFRIRLVEMTPQGQPGQPSDK